MSSSLRKLTLDELPGFSDLSTVAELQGLEEFTLILCASVRTLEPVGRLKNLRTLSVGTCGALEELGWCIRSPGKLEILRLSGCDLLKNDAMSLNELPSLREL